VPSAEAADKPDDEEDDEDQANPPDSATVIVSPTNFDSHTHSPQQRRRTTITTMIQSIERLRVLGRCHLAYAGSVPTFSRRIESR